MTNKKAKSLLYIFTVSQSHPGLKIKFQGQKNAFESLTTYTKTLAISILATDSPVKKAQKTVQFELLCTFYILFSRLTTIYIRYNPKTPLLLLAACLMSKLKTVWIEHNINYDTELNLLNRKWEWRLHRYSLWLFRHTWAHHIGVTPEITQVLQKSGIPFTATIQNGYTKPPTTTPPDIAIISQVKKFIQPNHRIAIMVTNGYRWHGVEEILELITPHPIQLIIVGPYPNLIPTTKILPLGPVQPDTLLHIYPLCDFGIGTFRLDMLGLTQASPLKTREYLGNGLPILVNYHDSAEDIPELAPYVFNHATTPNALLNITHTHFDHPTIEAIAGTHLNWASQLKPILESHV